MKVSILLFLTALVAGCATVNPSSNVNPPKIESNESVSNYLLAIIQDGETINSTVVTKDKGYTKTTDPDALISGALLKYGVTRVNSMPDTRKNEVLLVTWGISGSRKIGMLGAYSQEVTILMRNSELNTVYKCTAEGLGSTEADDIREAVFSCLSGLK